MAAQTHIQGGEMQTQEVAPTDPNPVFRLKNGTLVSRHLVNKVLSLKNDENGALLFNDLLMRCQDEPSEEEIRFVYFDGSISRLGSLGFLAPGGSVIQTFRDIVLDLAA